MPEGRAFLWLPSSSCLSRAPSRAQRGFYLLGLANEEAGETGEWRTGQDHQAACDLCRQPRLQPGPRGSLAVPAVTLSMQAGIGGQHHGPLQLPTLSPFHELSFLPSVRMPPGNSSCACPHGAPSGGSPKQWWDGLLSAEREGQVFHGDITMAPHQCFWPSCPPDQAYLPREVLQVAGCSCKVTHSYVPRLQTSPGPV